MAWRPGVGSAGVEVRPWWVSPVTLPLTRGSARPWTASMRQWVICPFLSSAPSTPEAYGRKAGWIRTAMLLAMLWLTIRE